MPKSEGAAMYKYMCEIDETEITRYGVSRIEQQGTLKEKADETIPPHHICFRTPPHSADYSVLDMQGIPTHDERGAEISK